MLVFGGRLQLACNSLGFFLKVSSGHTGSSRVKYRGVSTPGEHFGGSTYDGIRGNTRTLDHSIIYGRDFSRLCGLQRHMARDEGSREDGGFYGENGGRHRDDKGNHQS